MESRFWIETLGCKANQYDTERLLALLESLGWVRVSTPGEADLVLVNTCAVTSVAEKKSRQALGRARRLAPRATVAALGCLAAHLENRGAPLPPSCDLAVPAGAREEGLALLWEGLGLPGPPPPFPLLQGYHHRHRAFVKVQDGCDFHCTYCVIPSLRGPSRSRPREEVLRETATLVEGGTREVVLTGVCLGDWKEGEAGLEFLLEGLLELEGDFRIRLSSLEPERVTPSLLEVLARGVPRRFRPHLHLPLQSGSDKVLKRMGRRYSVGTFREILLQARRILGERFAWTTDVIAGFPGEEEGDFQDTLDLLEELSPARIHAFPYSPREGTPALKLPGQVPLSSRKERTARLLELGGRLARRAAGKALGTTQEVLLETEKEGLSELYQRVRLAGKERGEPGRLVEVAITGLEGEVLLGRPVEEGRRKAKGT